MAPFNDFPRATAGLASAQSPHVVTLGDGERFSLRIGPVAKTLGTDVVRMLAYNHSIPGPTLRVVEGSHLVVDVHNEGDLETTVHWHGLRLNNQYDGTTATQRPIGIGGRFTYQLTFPDPGVYWYHPHIREDYAQEMGLYGNIIVTPARPDYWPQVNRELALTLDDLLVEDGKVAAFDRTHPTFTAMGRFGTVLLVNGELQPRFTAGAGEVVRFYLTNTANTRVFNLALPGAVLKLVGGDSGHCERETFVENVVIAPSERVVVDALFAQAGPLALLHRTPAQAHTLASIAVETRPVDSLPATVFAELRVNADLAAERERIRPYLEAPPAKTLALVAEMDFSHLEAAPGTVALYVCPMHPEVTAREASRCPQCGMKLVPANLVGQPTPGHDHMHEDHDAEASAAETPPWAAGIEWEDDMVDVNRLTTPANMRWKLIDRDTGAEGPAIDWRFRVGDRVKIRIVNEMDSDHPMHHPFHIHGAGRFLVLTRGGSVESNLVWKDTVLVRTGETVEILLDVTNPGVWMAHCHIAEHHESGMMLSFLVDP